MKLSTVYLCVNDMVKSLNFYRFLLQNEPLYGNNDRWAVFDECPYANERPGRASVKFFKKALTTKA